MRDFFRICPVRDSLLLWLWIKIIIIIIIINDRNILFIFILLYLGQEGGGPVHRGHPGFGQAALLKLLRADLADGRGASRPGGPGASGQGSAMEESLEMFECNIWLESIEPKLGL